MIVFGTDGWRGVIAKDYTFDNLGLVALATANHIITLKEQSPSVVIGYDTRFLSKEFAEHCARVFASKGITAHLTNAFAGTPLVSYQTKQKGAVLGIVITASHNPPEYNGYKVKGSFGGPAIPEQIEKIEAEVRKLEGKKIDFKLKPTTFYVKEKLIRYFDPVESYIRWVRKKIDIKAIENANIKVYYDAMYGAGQGLLKRILPNIKEVHSEINPSFGAIDHPEPMAECLEISMAAMKRGKYDIGIATDGDADRLGAIDEDGNFIDSHRIFMLLLKYFVEDKGKKGAVAATVSLTSMVSTYCEKKNIKLYECPVGFKHISKLMNSEKIIVGGEESGGLGTMLHIPERDGIFNALLLMEMMVTRKKSLKQLCADLVKEFGPMMYRRRDVKTTEEHKKKVMAGCAKKPKKLGSQKVDRIDTTDGYKFYVDGGWLLIRASGTEPLLRFYSEAGSMSQVEYLLDEGMKLG